MGQVSNQSGTSWYPVITANSYKVAVLVMSLINYIHYTKGFLWVSSTRKERLLCMQPWKLYLSQLQQQIVNKDQY